MQAECHRGRNSRSTALAGRIPGSRTRGKPFANDCEIPTAAVTDERKLRDYNLSVNRSPPVLNNCRRLPSSRATLPGIIAHQTGNRSENRPARFGYPNKSPAAQRSGIETAIAAPTSPSAHLQETRTTLRPKAGNVTMTVGAKATRIQLLDIHSPPMRAFHMTWLAFLLCFFAWFGIAPLMPIVRQELQLTKDQIGWCIIGSVAITVFARLFIGWLCDRIGPRLAYSGLLIVGSLPVMGIALAYDFTTFLLFRVLIGVVGASFVITQYHTSVMFAPNCVGTANATTAGWGNLGGGVTQMVMPLVFTMFVSCLGFSTASGWRASMVAAGLLCAAMGVAYYFLTQDTPAGNVRELKAAGAWPLAGKGPSSFLSVCRDYRVWILFIAYGACFGVELTFNNILALYLVDYFDVFREMDGMRAMTIAGVTAGLFGTMNLFARTLGGFFGDRYGERYGLSGRVKWLFLTIFCEGIALMLFSQVTTLVIAIPMLILFSLFVQMSEGATYSVVPFINRRALGSVSGIVGAGGNAGAVMAGFLFKSEALTWPTALFILGACVTVASFPSLLISFTPEAELEASTATEAAMLNSSTSTTLVPAPSAAG